MHDGPSSCEQSLRRLLLLPCLPFVQQVLLLGLAARLLAVVVGNSLLDLAAAAAADVAIADMPRKTPKKV